MASFDESCYDEEAAWEERLFATLPGPAQVRALPSMESEKVTVLGKGTVVKVLERFTLENGTCRVRVEPKEDAGLGGWLSAKVLAGWRAVDRSRGEVKELVYGWKEGTEFALTAARTLEGVYFVRGVIGAAPTVGSEPTVLLFLHGGGYKLGVWLPVIEHLHVACKERGETYEVIAIDWIGHGRGRRLPGAGTASDRFDISELGPRDVFSVLDDAGDADGRFRTAGRRVVGVGHSNGAMILALAEQARPGSFAAPLPT